MKRVLIPVLAVIMGAWATIVIADVVIQLPSTIQPNLMTGLTQIPTYSAAVTDLANVADSDIYCVTGSDTKLVKVTGFCVSVEATSAIIADLTIVLRSEANSGGGLASVPVVKMDQLNPDATATVQSFTSAPTLGAAVGVVRSIKMHLDGTGSAGRSCQGTLYFPRNWGQPITLRGSSQSVCVHSSAVGAGGNWNVTHEHTEE